MSSTPTSIEGFDELKKKLEALDAASAGHNLEMAATAGSVLIEGEAKERVAKKTRTLSRSIHHETAVTRKDYAEIEIGPSEVYGRIQELGGTIKPKNAKYLAIPKTKTAEQYNPRDFKGLKIKMRPGASSGVLVDSKGTVQYVLVKSVTIPAKPYMRPAFDSKREDAVQEMGEVLQILLSKVTGP